MITPKFTCTQDESSVTISCYVPAVRAQDVEIHIDSTHFSLHIPPYFLRLTFPHSLTEDDESSAVYDPVRGVLDVKLTKEEKGQHFEDLDLLAKLLAGPPKDGDDSEDAGVGASGLAGLAGLTLDSGSKDASRAPLIEVLQSEENPDGKGDQGETEEARTERLQKERDIYLEAEANDWRLPQVLSTEDPSKPLLHATPNRRYGFLDAYSGFFRYQTENEAMQLGSDAEIASDETRRDVRLQKENDKWDEDYYMADYVNDEDIQEHVAWVNPLASADPVEFTEQEKATMLRLPRKEYLISPSQTKNLYLTLVQILFSYAYEARTTGQDPTPESPWTISILTPAFVTLDTSFTTPLEVLSASYRRALCFPLYRHWGLCEKLREDVSLILKAGKRNVARALMECKAILDRSEAYYVYSKIWVDDFCTWVMSGASDEELERLGRDIGELAIPKAVVGWNLEDLERQTREEAEESSEDSDESAEGDSDDESEAED